MADPPPVSYSSEAFQTLLDRWYEPVCRFVRGLVQSPEDAGDIAQEVFADGWRVSRRGTRPFTLPLDERALRNWLFHAAYCDAISLLRRRSVIAWERLDAEDANVDELSAHASEHISFEERVVEGEALRAALRSLSPEDIVCVRLGVLEDWTSIEIAQVLEITPAAARKRLSRAMRRLRGAYLAQQAPTQERAKP
jgi:RNA polymerase sigma factor (sigma-70 family)